MKVEYLPLSSWLYSQVPYLHLEPFHYSYSLPRKILHVIKHYRGSFPFSMSEVDKPMGNAELRLRLASIETIGMETHEQAKKTNGRVNWLEKTAWVASGAIPLLTLWAGWLTLHQLNSPQPVTEPQIQAAVQSAIDNYASNH
jgi:hypothetical protein